MISIACFQVRLSIGRSKCSILIWILNRIRTRKRFIWSVCSNLLPDSKWLIKRRFLVKLLLWEFLEIWWSHFSHLLLWYNIYYRFLQHFLETSQNWVAHTVRLYYRLIDHIIDLSDFEIILVRKGKVSFEDG